MFCVKTLKTVSKLGAMTEGSKYIDIFVNNSSEVLPQRIGKVDITFTRRPGRINITNAASCQTLHLLLPGFLCTCTGLFLGHNDRGAGQEDQQCHQIVAVHDDLRECTTCIVRKLNFHWEGDGNYSENLALPRPNLQRAENTYFILRAEDWI